MLLWNSTVASTAHSFLQPLESPSSLKLRCLPCGEPAGRPRGPGGRLAAIRSTKYRGVELSPEIPRSVRARLRVWAARWIATKAPRVATTLTRVIIGFLQVTHARTHHPPLRPCLGVALFCVPPSLASALAPLL